MGLSGPLISALASRSGFGTAISNAVARSYCVLQLSFADRIVVAASRLLGAAAACAILLYYCLVQLDLVNPIGVTASRLRK